MVDMQAATGKAKLPSPEDEGKEAFVAREPVIFMVPGEEQRRARVEALPSVPCMAEWSRHLCVGSTGWWYKTKLDVFIWKGVGG